MLLVVGGGGVHCKVISEPFAPAPLPYHLFPALIAANNFADVDVDDGRRLLNMLIELAGIVITYGLLR